MNTAPQDNEVTRAVEVAPKHAQGSASGKADVSASMGDILRRTKGLSAEQVNQALGQMDQVTQQNAALVEQAAAAAQAMSEQATELRSAVGIFKTAGGVVRPVPVVRAAAAAKPAPKAVSRPSLPVAPARAAKAQPAAGQGPSSSYKKDAGEGDWETF